MNIDPISKSSINSLDDLIELRLEHREIFNHYVSNSTCVVSSWWSQFPLFYGQTCRKHRKSYWVVLDNLFVPFVLNGTALSLFVLPFGDGAPDDYVNVLKKCTTLCNKINRYKSGNILVKWLNGDQIEFLKKSVYFDSAFSFHEYKVGPEYYYNIQNLITLSGKEYSYIRQKINKLKKSYENIIIRDYTDDDYDSVINLNNVWIDSASLRYKTLFDKSYFPQIVKHHSALHHIILVAVDENKIVGMISGEITNHKTGYCLFRKAFEGYDGLSQFLVVQLAAKLHSLDPDVKIINDGGAGKAEGLRFFKERFRPIDTPKRYKLRQGFRVLSSTAYEGPSIVGLIPSARIVVEGSSDLVNEIDRDRVATIKEVIVDILGDDLNIAAISLEDKPILIIAQVIIWLQQACRHEVKHYGYHIITASKYEIIFEIIRSSMLPKLVECIRILYDLITLGANAEALHRFYADNRQRFAFTLEEYIAHERKQTAKRFGISCYNNIGKKGWIGEGKHSRLLSFGYSEKTPAIGCHIARDKLESLNHIKQAGAPVPYQVNIKDERSLRKIVPTVSFPVVLKPRKGSKGKGVVLNIRSTQELIDSYKNNIFAKEPMVVQEHVNGYEFRLLVINDEFVAAVRRVPAYIEGDGIHNIAELIKIKNDVERRDGLYLVPIKIDYDLMQVLKKQNLSLDSRLNYKQKIQIREVSNVSLGGFTEDCTDIVHPDNKAAAVIAAKSCLLDVAGIDFVSDDISRSWKEGSGKIIEINNNPGVDLHMLPTLGKKREVTNHLLQSFVSVNGRGSIPKIVVTGYKGKGDVAERCFYLLKQMGYAPGLQLDDKVKTIYTETSLTGSFTTRSQQFLCNRELDAAVMSWKLSDLILSGSPCDSITCTVITDELIDPKSLARSHDERVHHRVYELLATITSHSIIIDAENENLYRVLEEVIPIKNLVLVSFNENGFASKKLQDHIDKRGKALFVIANEDAKTKTLLWNDGKVSRVISDKIKPSQNLLFALAAILSVNGTIEEIEKHITSSSHRRFVFGSNSLIKLDDLGAYTCDPRDNSALEAFVNWPWRRKGGCLWLIVTSHAGSTSFWNQWIEALQQQSLYVIFITNDHTCSFRRSIVLPSINIALELVYNHSNSDDTVLILDIGASIKTKTSINKPQDNKFLCTKNVFSSANLMQFFRGKWLNENHEIDYVNGVSLNPSTAKDEDIVVIPEYLDTLQSLTMVENAFAKNCRTVVTHVVPETLPKWRSVLLTEQPFLGVIQLAKVIRSRAEDIVFAIIGDKNLYNEFCAPLRETSSDELSYTYHSNFLNKRGMAKFEELLLEIINSQRSTNNNYSFFFLPDADVLSLRVLRPNVVLIDTFTYDIEPKQLFSTFGETCTTYIIINRDKEQQWRSELKNYSFLTAELIVVDIESSSYAMKKLLEKITRNKNYIGLTHLVPENAVNTSL